MMRSVTLTYHFQQDDSQDSVYSEETGHHHHNHSHGQVCADHADGWDPPTVDNRDIKTNVSFQLLHTECARMQMKFLASKKWYEN